MTSNSRRIYHFICFKPILLTAALLFTHSGAAQSLSKDFVDLEVVQGDRAYELYLENKALFDVTVTVDMTLNNVTVSDSLPYTTALQGKERKKAFEIEVKDSRSEQGSYESHYSFVMGNCDAVHDTSYVYHLPYRTGASYLVTQGYFGRLSHDESSDYAVDIQMSIGTEVCAAREGVVVGLFENSNHGGPDKKYSQLSNYIFIRHKDRTIAAYHHLKKNGVLVRIGQKVERGQVIGYSGNTGYTFAPHLHFEVFKAIDGRSTRSLPVKFLTATGVARELLEGESYQAVD